MYTDDLKEKRAADGKLTKNLKEERLEEANDLSTSVPNLSPALAQAIGLFEVDGMTIFLAGGGWLIARQGHISRLWRYR